MNSSISPITTRPQENFVVEEVVLLPNATTSQAGGDGGDVRVGGCVEEIPHPVLRGGCSQEEFQAFTLQWNLYAKYHNGMDVRELRQQLLNCVDGHLEATMYDTLGSKVDTLSETDLLEELEKLAVE